MRSENQNLKTAAMNTTLRASYNWASFASRVRISELEREILIASVISYMRNEKLQCTTAELDNAITEVNVHRTTCTTLEATVATMRAEQASFQKEIDALYDDEAAL